MFCRWILIGDSLTGVQERRRNGLDLLFVCFPFDQLASTKLLAIAGKMTAFCRSNQGRYQIDSSILV